MFRSKILIINFLVLSFLLISTGGFAASFRLEGQELVKGKLLERTAESTLLETPYGLIRVPNKKVLTMDFTGETIAYQIILTDKSQVNGNLMLLEDNSFIINTNAGIISLEINKVAFIREVQYSRKLSEESLEKQKALEIEELKAKSDRLNQLRFLAGYGLLQGDFAQTYKNNLLFQVSYDRVFFLESFRNLRLGIAISYQAFNATYVDNVEMEVLSYLVSARYMFPLAKDGFLKILTPFISLGLGTSQLRLTKADNSSEGGMNSTIQGGLGLDIFINYNVDLNLEANYKLIMGQGEYALSILQLLAGVSWKF